MEKSKICLSFNWNNQDSSINLEIIKNVILSNGSEVVDYLAIDLAKSGIRRPLDFDEIDSLCREKGISWFPIVSSIRDINSTRPYYSKLPNGRSGFMLGVPADCLTDFTILEHAKACSDYLILYTGQSTQGEIDRAIEAAQPDLIIHQSFGEVKLDYIKYLQAITIEFEKRYLTGFKNNSDDPKILLVGAAMLDAVFLESTMDSIVSHLLDTELADLRYYLDAIQSSRGGYEARKLSKVEKEMKKK